MQTDRLTNLYQRRATLSRSTALLALALVLTAAAIASNRPSIVTASTVRAIESKIVMPPRADPLANYDRYYMLTTLTAQGMAPRAAVHGRFMLRAMGTHFRKGAVAVPGVPNAFTIERGGTLPNVADGGCGVVTIFFDLTTGNLIEIQHDYKGAKPERASCNGYG